MLLILFTINAFISCNQNTWKKSILKKFDRNIKHPVLNSLYHHVKRVTKTWKYDKELLPSLDSSELLLLWLSLKRLVTENCLVLLVLSLALYSLGLPKSEICPSKPNISTSCHAKNWKLNFAKIGLVSVPFNFRPNTL